MIVAEIFDRLRNGVPYYMPAESTPDVVGGGKLASFLPGLHLLGPRSHATFGMRAGDR